MLDAENEQFLGDDSAKYEAIVHKRLQEYLGPGRFAEFKRGMDPGFRKLALLAEGHGASIEAAGEMYGMEQMTAAKARELLADPKTSEGEKRSALADLREGLRQKMRTLFGVRALESYELNGGFKLPEIERK